MGMACDMEDHEDKEELCRMKVVESVYYFSAVPVAAHDRAIQT